MESARRSAAALIEAECRDPWLAIDSVLNRLAERSRRYPPSEDAEELTEPAFRAAAVASEEEVRLRRCLDEVTRERDRLRARLVASQRELRALRAGLELRDHPHATAGADTGRAPWLLWLRWRRRGSTGGTTGTQRPAGKS